MEQVSIYGSPKPSSDKTYHRTTHLEYEVPEAIEDQLDQFIEKAIDAFEKVCQCDGCVEERKKPPIKEA